MPNVTNDNTRAKPNGLRKRKRKVSPRRQDYSTLADEDDFDLDDGPVRDTDSGRVSNQNVGAAGRSHRLVADCEDEDEVFEDDVDGEDEGLEEECDCDGEDEELEEECDFELDDADLARLEPEDPASPVALDEHEEYLARLNERVHRNREQGLSGVCTGIQKVDDATGGVRGVAFLAGKDGSGKTSFAVQTTLAGMEADHSLATLWCSLDDTSADDVRDMMVCHLARVDYRKFESRVLDDAEKRRVKDAFEKLRGNIWNRTRIVDRQQLRTEFTTDEYGYTQGMDWRWIWKSAVRLANRLALPRVLTVVDLFQKMPLPRYQRKDRPPELADADQYRLDQLLEFRTETKKVCPDGWPVIAISELRKKQGTGPRTLKSDDVYGPADLAYEATQMLLLEPNDDFDSASRSIPTELRLAKVRRAQRGTIPLIFHHSQFRFDVAGDADVARGASNDGRNPTATLDSRNDL